MFLERRAFDATFDIALLPLDADARLPRMHEFTRRRASIAQSLIGLYVVIGQDNAPRKKLAAVEGIPVAGEEDRRDLGRTVGRGLSEQYDAKEKRRITRSARQNGGQPEAVAREN